ncbi:MAG: Dam family site-specific DNA-(adenine-N6)-methyltransferase [Proteobacteria bacterium]|nr:Dam family site-specific DNA-(adenine-N6)-methyltransferase [Pseudomonadota bacterium]
MKPFLKWPGGKYRLVERIKSALQPAQRLIEPFAGSAAVFLNTDYNEYLIADSNNDLINLYQRLIDEGDSFIKYCHTLISQENNNEQIYYKFREEFNRSRSIRRRSALFLYLNRHCYNGLCRYNKSGKFNTPFGRYKKPYFPQKEMRNFIDTASNATFINADFLDSMARAKQGDVIYCDPPYAPLSQTANFTDYHTSGFNWQDQVQLVDMARKLADEGIPVIISNHDTKETRKLYNDARARIEYFHVQRSISCDGNNRTKAGELLAVFS